MPNKKINQLDARVAISTDLMLVGDPTTGTSFKSTVATLPLVPYTGATANVNLGEFEMKAGQLTLDLTPTGTAAVSTTRWNDTNGVSETTLKGGSVVLKNGIDLVARVVNKVNPNATLTKAAYQAVRVSGAQGQRLAVALAQANNDANSADTIGLVTETIATNQEGFIMTVGQLENINTTGSLQGETWVDGDVLYLSPTTAGAITKVKPTGNGHIVVIGYVEYAHVNNGKIYVKVMNGWELDELHDVNIVTPLNNEALIYETATALWKNKSIATALGYTPQQALTLTTTGTSGASTLVGATLNIPQYQGVLTNPITGSGTTNYLPKFTGATTLGNSQVRDDGTNVGIGIAPTLFKLRVEGSQYPFRAYGTNGNGIILNPSYNYYDAFEHVFRSLNATSTYATLFNTGNFGIGTGASDSGQRLQVTGDTLLKGSGATSATTALTVQNSSSQNIFRVLNNGEFRLGNGANFIYAFTYSSTYDTIDINGGNFTIYPSNGSISLGGGTQIQTSGTQNNLITKGRFQPTSGTATFTEIRSEALINQTGGASGITRGLYVNPTLTAAADWRSIEWSNNTGWGLYGAGTCNNYLNGSLSIGNTTVSTFGNGGITLGSTTNGKSLVLTSSVAGNNGLVQFIDTSGSDAFQIAASTTNISLYGYGARPMILWTNGSERARIFSNGNFGINTGATDSGEKLQVNGTAKITGATLQTGTGILRTENTGINAPSGSAGVGAEIFVNVGKTWYTSFNRTTSAYAPVSLYGSVIDLNGGNVLIGSTTDSGERLQVNGTAKITGASTFGGLITVNSSATTLLQLTSTGAAAFMGMSDSSGNFTYIGSDDGSFIIQTPGSSFSNKLVINSAGAATFSSSVQAGGGTTNASAILQADSTTKGFLPPRMTTVQKNAIATPAAGLMVYDTTLNQMSYYNATMWINF